jgi:Uma2 family endonuclease
MVWVVDPEDRHVVVYRRADEGKILHEPSSLSGEEVLPGFLCKISDIFV